MGRGNYYPRNLPKDESGYPYGFDMVYVDIENDMYDDYAVAEENYDDLIMEILYNLPKSFSRVNRLYIGREERVVAQNQLIAVTVADNEWSIAVIIRLNENLDKRYHGLACNHVYRLANKLFKKLANVYRDSVYVRSGPWTSQKFVLE